MQIIHHIGLRADGQKRASFLEAGVELATGARSAGMVSFEIAEDDPRWPKVAALCSTFRVFDSVSTRFTTAERNTAQYLGMVALGHRGYPEPSDDAGYLRATFDLAGYCRVCGIGLTQVEPFRMRKVPRLGNTSILQLNWILDEFFVTPAVWVSTFHALGIGCRPVVLDKTGAEIDSVVQLDISQRCDVRVDGIESNTCPSCGRTKHRYSLRGPYPEPRGAEALMFKSSQYFGIGAQAFRLVVVANVLYQSVTRSGLRGVTFYPCPG